MNGAFFGLLALAAILWAHAIYTWYKAGKPEMKKGTGILLIITASLTLAAVIAGLLGPLFQAPDAMTYAMGLIALVLSLWGNYQLGRICRDQ